MSAPAKAGDKPYAFMREAARRGMRVRMMGSASAEMCLVARGLSDAYIDAWDTIRVVDMAAGYLIVREAGAYTVLDLVRGREDATLDLKERLNFAAAASRELLEVVVEIRRRALGT